MLVRQQSRLRTDGLGGEDLSPVDQLSLDAALRQLRPEWFRLPASPPLAAMPTIVAVYIDLVYSGGIDALRLVPVSAVRDVRHLTPSAARDRFGPWCPCSGGVILVTTRKTQDANDAARAW
jgi:hypothetical protein